MKQSNIKKLKQEDSLEDELNELDCFIVKKLFKNNKSFKKVIIKKNKNDKD